MLFPWNFVLFSIIYFTYCIFFSNAKYHGSLTSYGDEWRGNNCGYETLLWEKNMKKNDGEMYFAAINAPQWNHGYECGRCAKIQCTSKGCENRPTLTVMILNQCPECSLYDLDVSDKAFHILTGSTPSRYNIKWEFVVCPKEFINGNMNMHLKEGSNPYFIALQPRNSIQPISKVEIIPKK